FAAVFLPKAVVHNVVQAEQLDRKWVLGRAFREGRGETRLQASVSWCDLARLTKRALWATPRYSWGRMRHRRSDPFHRLISCALTRGRLYEAWRLKLGLRLASGQCPQAEVRLVNQRGCLERLARSLMCQPLGRQLAKLLVNQRQQLLRSVRVGTR